MRSIIKNLGVVAGICALFLVVSCSDGIPEREPSPEMAADCQSVYFGESVIVNLEFEPEDSQVFTLSIKREKTTKAITVPIHVLLNEEDIFSIPESVSFAAGEEEAIINISFPNAAEGITYKLEMELEGDEVNAYIDQPTSITVDVTRIKWNKYDAIFTEGIVSAFFGVAYPTYCSMYKTAEIATLQGGEVRVRITDPYAPATADPDDYLVADGYLYNASSNMLDKKAQLIIKITENGVLIEDTALGFQRGYGEFFTGSTYLINKDNYDAGEVFYTKDGEIDYIFFDDSTLYTYMVDYNDGQKRVVSNPTYICFSLKTYMKVVHGEEID